MIKYAYGRKIAYGEERSFVNEKKEKEEARSSWRKSRKK